MKLSEQLKRDFIGRYDCPDAIVEIAADLLEECERAFAIMADGRGDPLALSQRMLAKLRKEPDE